MDIKVKVEGLSKVKGNLKKKIESLQDLTEFFQVTGAYIQRRTIKECFDKEQAPDGSKWKALSQARIRQRKKRHKKGNMKILQDVGELRRSIKYQAARDNVVIGSHLKYSRVHQFGYADKNIPARPYLGITEQDRQHIIKTFQEYIKLHVH